MTIITIGTSFPEIVMSVIAVKKNEFDFTLGNIIGTNIFNIGIVLGLPLMLCGGITPISFAGPDMIMLLISVKASLWWSLMASMAILIRAAKR